MAIMPRLCDAKVCAMDLPVGKKWNSLLSYSLPYDSAKTTFKRRKHTNSFQF